MRRNGLASKLQARRLKVWQGGLPYCGPLELGLHPATFLLDNQCICFTDDSGDARDPNQRHFILGAVSFFERQTHWVSEELEKVAARFNPDTPHEVELHGSPMFKGSSRWRRVPREVRVRAICDALRILADSHQQNRIFVVAVDKSRASPRNAVEIAFEQLASRFDQYLMRLHRARNTQRGLMIFDKSTQETTLQGLARDFKRIGHSFGQVRNLAEVPVFIDSRASRLVQLADLVAYAAYQHYEHHNDLFWDIIVGRLDATGGVVHGLYYHR